MAGLVNIDLGQIFGLGEKILDKIFPDPAAKADALLKLRQLEQSGELAKLTAETDLLKGQLDINKIEAASSSLLVSGARPFILWVLGGALLYCYILSPIFSWASAILSLGLPPPPTLDDHLWELMTGMLGMSGWRSWDKKNGVASK